MSTAGPHRRSVRESRFRLPAILIVALAFCVRLLFVWMGTIEFPIRGDINQYVLYGWNLSHRGVFSTDLPDTVAPVPDSYRAPGYPALLACAMLAAGHADLPLRPGPSGMAALGYETDAWMRIVLGLQVLLGTATVWLVIVVGRSWLPAPAALAAGLITALWPHLVSFTGFLLSETLFAFTLMLALWLLVRAASVGGIRAMAGAGAAWGIAYLVNPIVALFPVIAAIVLWRRSRRLAATLLAAFMLFPAAWSARNAVSAAGGGALQRVEENFVQGSWPQFLTALNSRFNNEISRQIVAAVDAETRAVKAAPVLGLREIAARMALDPMFFLRWYALEKPFLLWDWHLRVGAGDIYFLPVEHSPFERIPVLALVKSAFRWINPFLFALAMLVAIVVPARRLFARDRSESAQFAPLLLSLLLLYLTAVHVALQAEPRYSVPYRPLQVLLAVSAVAWIGIALARRRDVLDAKQRDGGAAGPSISEPTDV